IRPSWNIIWGFPGESAESYDQVAHLVPLLTHLPPPLSGGPVQMERFSPLFNQADAFGLINVRPNPGYAYIHRLGAEAAFNIAYHFDFDYRDERAMNTYTCPLLEQIRIWKSVHETSALFFSDTDDVLSIWDFRPIAHERNVRLEGNQR